MLSPDGYRVLGGVAQGPVHVVARGRRLADDRAVVLKGFAEDYPAPERLVRLRHELELTRRAASPYTIGAWDGAFGGDHAYATCNSPPDCVYKRTQLS